MSSTQSRTGAGRLTGMRLAAWVAAAAVLMTTATWAAGAASLRVTRAEDRYGRLVAVVGRIPALAGRVEALAAGVADPRTDPARLDQMRAELRETADRMVLIAVPMRGEASTGELDAIDAAAIRPVLDHLGLGLPETVITYADSARRAADPGADLSPGSLLRGNLDGEYLPLMTQVQQVDVALRGAAQDEQQQWSRLVTASVLGLGLFGALMVALAIGPIGGLLRRHREQEGALEQARQDAAAHITQLVDGVDAAVVAVNDDGSQLTVNAAARLLFGLPPGTPLSLDDVLSSVQMLPTAGGRALPSGRLPLATALHGERTSAEFTLVLHHDSDDEQRRQVAVHARPLVSPDGRTLGAIMTIHDLTELHARNRATARHAQQLDAIGRATAAVLRVEDARSAVCAAAIAVTGGVVANLFEPDGHGDLVCTAAEGVELVGLRVPQNGRSVLATTFATAAARTTQDIATDQDADHQTVARLSELSGLPVGAAAWVPVIDRGRCVAVLTVAFTDRQATVADLLPPLEILASEAAFALERQTLLRRLALEAERDGLTGAANRRTWETRLPAAVEQARRTGDPLSVVVLDIDHFKAYNDQHGHPAGDELLRLAVTGWQGRLRPSDLLARYGGEEFAVLLPGCPAEAARSVAEALRVLMPSGSTCSAGIATWDGTEPAHRLVSRADTALYAAKHGGRNQTALAPDPDDAPPPSSTTPVGERAGTAVGASEREPA